MAPTKLLAALLIATALLLLSHPPPPVVAGTGGVGVCEKVECGKGKCVASKHSAVGFVCKCDAGWLQSALDGYTDGNDFLPCVYPNCSLDLAWASWNSPFPAPMESPPAYDRPLLNPCRPVGELRMPLLFSIVDGATLSNRSSSPFSSSPPPSPPRLTKLVTGGASIMKKMKLEWL